MLSFFRMRGNNQDSKKSSKRADRRRLDGLFSRNLRIESLEERQLLSISPTIGSLAVSPTTVSRSAEITLAASNVLAGAGHTIAKVDFYRDVDGNSQFNAQVDQLLGEDLSSVNGWSVTASTTTFSAGTQTYFVQATDSAGLVSNVPTASNTIFPYVSIRGASSVKEGSTYTLNLTSDNPGADPVNYWTVNWGDGAASEQISGAATTATHVYANKGSYAITATATYEDGTYAVGGLCSLDVVYNGGAAVSADACTSMAVQADGKSVVIGFENGNFVLVRYNANGSLDATFGANGKVTTNFGGEDRAYSVAIQADGKIVVAGTCDGDFALARYNANGSLDATFSGDGKVTTDFGGYDVGYSISIQADGKIVVVGTCNGEGAIGFYSFSTSGFILARYNADGSLDTTFSGDGKVSTQINAGTPEYAYASLIQADGKIVVGGTSNGHFALVRYDVNGNIDTTFGSNGVTLTALDSIYGNVITALAVQSDGKIVAGGEYVGDNSNYQFGLARYSADGVLDTTFGVNGKVVANYNLVENLGYGGIPTGTFSSGSPTGDQDWMGYGGSYFSGLAIQADDKIVAVGSINNEDFTVVRYDADGALDTNFGDDGILTADVNDGSYDGARVVKVLADGKILVAGNSNDGTQNGIGLARFNPGDFSKNVSATNVAPYVSISGASSVKEGSTYTLNLIAEDPGTNAVNYWTVNWGDGAASEQISGAATTATHVYANKGSYAITATATDEDGTYAVGGLCSLDVVYNGGAAVSADACTSMAVQADGKSVVIGFENGNFVLVRYNANGSLDATFGANGKVTTNFGGEDRAYSVAIQADGKIVVAGTCDGDFALARYNANGSLDATFSGDGKVTTDFGGYDVGYSISIQADGKIVVVGTCNGEGAIGFYSFSTSGFILARYNADGSLDTTFSGDGKVSTQINAGTPEYAYASLIQADGKIVVGGTSNGHFALVRYDVNGNIDTTFGSNGVTLTALDSIYGNVITALAVQSDGKIVAGGEYVGDNSNYQFGLARYSADGVLDTTFGVNGKVVANYNLVENLGYGGIPTGTFSSGSPTGDQDWMGYGGSYFSGLAIQADDKIVAVGSINNEDFTVVRYDADGALDTNFGDDGILTADVNDGSYDGARVVKVLADGKILVAGNSNDGTQNGIGLARFNPGDFSKNVSATNVAPYVSISGASSVKEGSTYTLNLIAEDPGTNAVNYWTVNWGDGAASEQISGAATTATHVYANKGSYAITATATDEDGTYAVGGLCSLDVVYNGGAAVSADACTSMAVQADGKSVVIGFENGNFVLVRYNANGSLDATFGANGKVTTNFGGEDRAYSVAIQADGKIVVAGTCDGDFALARYNANGSLDATFSGDGKVTTDFGGYDVGYSISIQADGKIVVVGTCNGEGAIGFYSFSTSGFILARYNADGSLDTTFSGDGKVSTQINAGTPEYAYASLIQADGKIVVGGTSNGHFALVRYDVNGNIDTTFGSNGVTLTALDSIYGNVITALAVQSDGKIVAGGEYVGDNSNYQFGLARYSADGVLDTTFGVNGKVVANYNLVENLGYGGIPTGTFSSGSPTGDQDWMGYGGSYFSGLAIQADDKIVAVGSINNEDFTVVRYDADGALDTNFGDDGILTADVNDGSYDGARVVKVLADGKILVAGNSNDGTQNGIGLARFNPGDFSKNVSVEASISTIQAQAFSYSSESNLYSLNYSVTGSVSASIVVNVYRSANGASTGEILDSYVISASSLLSVGSHSVTFAPAANIDAVDGALIATISNGQTNSQATTNVVAQPTSLAVTATSTSVIHLAWTDNSYGESGFEIQRSLNGVDWTPLISRPANTLSYDDQNLTEGTKYYYRVRATSATENSAYCASRFATTYLNAPTDLSVSSISVNQVSLQWNYNSTQSTSYVIEQLASNGDWFAIGTSTSSSATISPNSPFDLTKTNKFRVYAVVGDLTSPPSNVATVKAALCIRHWTGSAGSNLWSVAENWSNGVPQAGDVIEFDNACVTYNDLSAGTVFDSIKITANNVKLEGNEITLNSGISLSAENAQSEISLNVTIANSAAFEAAKNSGLLMSGGIVANASSLTKSGDGLLTLANGLSGHTVQIDAGTLKIGAASVLTSLSLSNGGILDLNGFQLVVSKITASSGSVIENSDSDVASIEVYVNQNTTNVFAGSIKVGQGYGEVALTKSGGGTLVLSGKNESAVATTVAGGTLQVGNEFGNGSIVGNIVNNATLKFQTTLSQTYDGVISGSGSLIKSGTGTLILTAVHSFTGETTISQGTLQIGDGLTTGSVLGAIVNNGVLTLFPAGDISFANAVSGTGSLKYLGTGTITFNSANTYTYTGYTEISSGSMNLVGTISNPSNTSATGDVLVRNAELVGNGSTSHGVTIDRGGVLNPIENGSPTTISVGDLVLNAGAVLKTTVNRTGAPYGPFGQVVVTGRVTIYDAELTLLGDDGDGSQLAIVIIQNDGTDSVQGRFGQKIRTASGEETTQEIAEGSAVNVNYVISYCYNAETGKFFSGNDVALIKKDDYYAALTFTTPASVSYYGGVTAYLSVGASSRLDASDLIYTWEVVSKPAGAADPQFSVNASSSSYNSTVSLFAAGEYKFRVSVTSSTEFCLQSEEVTLNVEQVASSISVDPQLTIVPSGGTQQFSAIAYDQFGDELAVQPTFTWSANEGTVTQDGLWTAPSRESNSSGIQVTATCYDENGSRQCDGAGTVYVTNSRPEIDQAAKAEISADGRSATLSVLGKDDAGEGLLTYSWTAVALTPGASTPSFSNYNDNLNKSITASFSSIGTYRFIVTIKDAGGLATMTDVVVTVSQVLSGIQIQTISGHLVPGESYQLSAVGLDQFNNKMDVVPACQWSSETSDYFTLSADGVVTVADKALDYPKPFTFTAVTNSGLTDSANFEIGDDDPTVSISAVATMNDGNMSAKLSVLGDDDSGESNLTYHWCYLSKPYGVDANPSFEVNDTNSAKNTVVHFFGVGEYLLRAIITDKYGYYITSDVTVNVEQTFTTITFSNAPNSVAANGSVSLALLYADQFGNTMTASDLSDSAVTWRATAGSISADGTYYAPNASMPVTITAEKDGVSVSKSINVVVASPTTSARTGDSWMESYWEAMLGSSGTSGTGLQHYRQITGQSVVTVNGGSYSVTPNSVAAPGAFVLTTKGNYSSNTGTVTTTLDYVCTVGDSSYSVRETDASSLTITATLNADNSWTYLETYTLTYGIAMLSGTSLPHAAGSYTYTFSAYGSASTSYYTCTVVASMEAAGSYVVDGVTGDWTQTVSNSDTISYTSAGVSRSGSGSTTANSVLGGETYSPSNSYQYAIYYALSSGTWTASGSASNVKALSQTSNSTGDDTTDGITQSWTKFDASSYRYQSNYSYAGTATTGAWTMTSGGGSSSGSGSGSSEYFGGGSYSYSASGGTISGGYSKSGNNASVYSYQATATWSSASGWSQSGSKTVANSGEQYYSYSGAGMYADSSTDDDQSYSVSGVQSENGSDHEIYSETDSYALASDGTWAFVNSVSWTAGNGYGYSAYSGAGQYAYSDSSQSMSGTFSENGYDRRVYNYDGRTSSAVETISGEDSYSYSGSGSYTSLKVSLLDEHDVIQSFSGALSESGSTWESFNENNYYSQSNGNWILQSGVGVSSGSGSSHSSYSGSGSYVHYDYAFYNSTDNDYDVMRGDFAESGSEDSSYNYNLNGTAAGGVWSYSGSQTNTSGGQALFSAHASGKVDSSWNNYSATGTRSEDCNADGSYSYSLYYKANAANGDWESSGGTGFSAGGGYRYQTLSASGDYSASGNYYNSKIAGKFSFGSGSGYSYSYDTDSSYSDGEWTTSGSGTESLYGSSRSDYSGSGSYTRSNWRGDGTTTGTLAESGHAGETYSYVKNYDIESDGSWRETNGTGGSSGSGFTYSQYSGEGDYSSTVYGSSCEGAVTENGWEGSSYSFKTEAKFNNGYWKESGSKTASGSGHSWRDFDGTGAFSNSQLGSGFDLNGTVDENGWDETNFISKKEYALDLNGDWQAASGSATASGSGLMHASYSASGAFSSMSVYYGEAQGNASASGFDDSSYNYSENYSLNITTDTWCGASGSGGTSGSGETHWSYVGSGSMTVNRYDIPVNGYQNYYWNGLSVPSNFTASGKDDSSYEYETTATCYRGNWSQSGSRAATASGSSSGSYSGTKSYTVAGWSGITGTMSASGDSSDSYYYTVGSKLRANGEWKDLTGSGSASGTGNDHWSYAESGNYSWSTSPYYYYGYYAGNSYTVSGSASASGHGDAHREYSTSSNLKVVDYWSHWITSGSATTTEEGGMNYSYSGSGSGAWSSHDEDSGDHYEWSRDDAADSAYSEKGSGDFTYYQRTVWTNKNDNWSVQSQVLSSSGSTHASTHFSAHASGSNYSYTEGYYGESEYNSDYRMSASSDLYYDGSFSEHVTRSRNSKGQLVTSGTSQESRHYSGSSDYDWADNNFGNSDSYYWYDSVESNNHSKFHENSDYDCIDTFVTTYDSDGNAVYSSTYDDYYHWGYSSSSWGSATYTYSNGEKDHTSYSNSYGDSWTSDGGYGWYWWGGYYYGYYSYYGRPSGSNPYGADVLTTCPNGLQNPAETNGSLHNGYFGGLGFSSATGVKSIVASEAGKALPLIPHGTGYYYYNFTACAPWLASYSVTTSSFAWLAPTTAANMTVNGGYVPWMARFDISTPRANKVPNLNNSVLKGNSDSAATAATAAAKSAAPGSSYSFGNGILASFDDAGNLIGLTDPTANETTWNYDDSNRVTSVSDELGNSKLYVYDDSDNLVRYTDANGRVTTYAFDAAGRVVSEVWYENATDADAELNAINSFSYVYDSQGRVLSESDNYSSIAYVYDPQGRKISVTQSSEGDPTVVFTYTYDDDNENPTSVAAMIDGVMDYVNYYAYDSNGKLTQIIQDCGDESNSIANKEVNISYDSAGNVVSIDRYELGSYVASSYYTYDSLGRLTGLTHRQGDTVLAYYAWTYASDDATAALETASQTADYFDLVSSYDANTIDLTNLVSDVSEAALIATCTSADGTATYAYDASGQVTGAGYSSGTLSDESYTYDANGNRTSGGYVIGADNRILSDGTYAYAYDAEGNRVAKFVDEDADGLLDAGDSDVTAYVWDNRDRLTEVVSYVTYGGAASQDVKYFYDVKNRLIREELDADGAGEAAATAKAFAYDGKQIALQFDGEADETLTRDDLSHRYLWNPQAVDQILADEQLTKIESGYDVTSPGTVVWPLTDNLGSVRDLAVQDAATGVTSVVNHRVYDVFGNLKSETNPATGLAAAVDSVFGFTGRLHDDATGLQNNLNRWYDSKTGSWTSKDPSSFNGGDANLYRYVGNSPLNATDPTGLWKVTKTPIRGAPVHEDISEQAAIAARLLYIDGDGQVRSTTHVDYKSSLNVGGGLYNGIMSGSKWTDMPDGYVKSSIYLVTEHQSMFGQDLKATADTHHGSTVFRHGMTNHLVGGGVSMESAEKLAGDIATWICDQYYAALKSMFCREYVKAGLEIGKALHTIADLYCPSHVERTSVDGTIIRFQDYDAQYVVQHEADDYVNDFTRPYYKEAIKKCSELLMIFRSDIITVGDWINGGVMADKKTVDNNIRKWCTDRILQITSSTENGGVAKRYSLQLPATNDGLLITPSGGRMPTDY